jgi:hypothetical protein
MNRSRNIIIARLRPTLWVATVLLAAAAMAFAHAGFDHVKGTVAKVSGNALTIKTAKGNVDVKLGDRTEFTRNDQKAQVTDLKPGLRVVAEVPEGSKDNVAQSIKIGAAPKTAAVRQSHVSHR